MTAKKWLALPDGTKVRMTCDYVDLTKWDIATRVCCSADNVHSVLFCSSSNYYFYLTDDQWELIEEEKAEVVETRLPKQGDKVQVRRIHWDEGDWDLELYNFVCLYRNKVIVEDKGWSLRWYDQWRFPPQEEVTLSDGKTYLVEERDGEKILKLKQ